MQEHAVTIRAAFAAKKISEDTTVRTHPKIRAEVWPTQCNHPAFARLIIAILFVFCRELFFIEVHTAHSARFPRGRRDALRRVR